MVTSNSTWSTQKKILFRYVFTFWSLVVFPFPFTIIVGEGIVNLYNRLWTPIVNFFGRIFFGTEQYLTVEINGSGDRLYDWLWYFSLILITLFIGTIFSALDRNRKITPVYKNG